MRAETVKDRLLEFEGVQYYSPNCTREAPISVEGLLEDTNPFQLRRTRRSEVRYKDLLRPRIWQKAFYWTAFIPMEHWYKNYRHPPFNILGSLPCIEWHEEGEKYGYRILPNNSFAQLESDIYEAVVALKNKFDLPCVLPFLPNTRAYQSTFRKRAQLVHALAEAREWFSVWLGALSYCIAMARTREQQTKDLKLKYSGYPGWRKVLKDAGLSEGWIDDIMRSPVGNFAFKVPRVGCILKVIDAHPDQPAKDWFINLYIPIWYRCGVEEQEWNKSGSQVPEIVCDKSGGGVESTLEESANDTVDPAACQTEPPWVSFFAKREAQYACILRTETAIDRQRRENRIRNKPIRRAAVFEWLQDHEDPIRWDRVPVTQRCKLDTLSLYHQHQIRYDPFFNEWDCCQEFMFGDPQYNSDSDDDRWDHPPATSAVAVDNTGISPEAEAEGEASPDLFSQTSQSPIQQEVDEVFGGYYGFCPPVIGTSLPDVSIDERTADWFVRLLGLGRNDRGHMDEEYLQSYHYKAAQLFVDGIVGIKPYQDILYDTKDASLRPVRLLPRFSAIVRLDLRGASKDTECLDNGDNLYVFNFAKSTVPWKLATHSPITALIICRLPPDYDETSIAFHLAQRGIPFRILHPKPRIRRLTPKPVVHDTPVRKWDHRFTREDYDSYVNHRTYLLGQPQMQAMLRRGGIAWRLAIGSLGIGEVVKEPTMWGHQFSPTSALVEDTVTTLELDLLCGAYECITDDGKKRALKSWWPLVRYYEKAECGDNHGHWSSRRETWFLERLLAIQNSDETPQPLSYTEWKSKLHGVKGVRSFLAQVTRASEALIGEHAPAQMPD
ncbi:hypothetical protein EST38_g6671 [Candolleomyces aberdarensis]|uniref:Uncharacterized protein n=1 Tax=Candolleomyces aberdarensis TaxID=2316362 RepID=A0A4V1Q3N4_9AGAR|nr:hypothetical protein EST38_g6671 [Candolleomyces aberdarensis]